MKFVSGVRVHNPLRRNHETPTTKHGETTKSDMYGHGASGAVHEIKRETREGPPSQELASEELAEEEPHPSAEGRQPLSVDSLDRDKPKDIKCIVWFEDPKQLIKR
jgi:hypothetical protein